MSSHHGKVVKCGKKTARHDKRALMLTNYLQPHLPLAPPAQAWDVGVDSWPMYLNDQIGDCTCAAAGHMIQAWTTSGQHHDVKISESDVKNAYKAVGGYVEGDETTDNGAIELDVLKYWRKTGIGGHKIGAFVSVNPKNDALVKDAIWLTGGLYIGLSLPESAQSQKVWDVPPGGAHDHGAPGSWGGHAVNIVAYSPRGLTAITWGAPQFMTWNFMHTYCDEAYAILSQDFLSHDKAPNGFDSKQLLADLALL